MSEQKIYSQALQAKTLIAQTLMSWSALSSSIIVFVKMDDLIKLFLSVFTCVLVVATIVCVRQWIKLFIAYTDALKEERCTN